MARKVLNVSRSILMAGVVLAAVASFEDPASTTPVEFSESVVTPRSGLVVPASSPVMPVRHRSNPMRRRANIAAAFPSSRFSPLRSAHAASGDAALTEWDVGDALRHPLAWHEASRTLYFVRGYGQPRLIVRLDPATGQMTEWAVPGEGLFRLFVDQSSGHVFFADFVRTVRRLDPATNEITEWTFPVTEHDPDGEIHTAGMDTDTAGNLWIMGYHNHTVYRLNLDSNLLTAYPIPHQDQQNPDILVDQEGNVIWQAQETNTMNVLFPKTNLYKEWPLPSFRRHLFGIGTGNPASLNLGHRHEIIFGAPAVNKIVRLNTETNVVSEWTEWEIHHDQGFDQSYVAVGGDKSRIYLTDSETGRIGMLDTRRRQLSEWRLPQDGYRGPTTLLIDPRNRLFFAEEGASRVGMLDPSSPSRQQGDE